MGGKTTGAKRSRATPAITPGITPGQARRESARARRERAAAILARLRPEHPDPRTALDFASPLQLLVATILAAQCTDQKVNQVTPELFRRLPGARDLAEVPIELLEELVHATGFFRQKARTLRALGQALVAEHGGRMPETMEELVRLPGVGRKTANVVLGNALGKNEGVVVDTHVQRLSRRLFLTEETDPEKIERDLMAVLPRETWTEAANLLILHGRSICQARKPQCGRCAVNDLCPSAEV